MGTVCVFITALLSVQTLAIIDNSDIIEGSNIFGYELSNLVFDSSKNLWISPFCITSCFSLIYPGCGTDSNTQIEIAEVMGFPTSTSDPGDVTQQFFTLQGSIDSTYTGEGARSSIIGIANKIFASKLISLKQSYISALYDTIRQESFIDETFDFSADNATGIINQWVDENTNGLIDSIVDKDADLSDYRLMALNAIYLNGSFSSPFEKYMTSAQKFYTDVTRTTEASDIHLMHQIEYFMYYEDANYQFLKFPFSDNEDLFILYALPKVAGVSIGDRPGLRTDNEYINTVIENLESKYIALALPKLDIAETYSDTLVTALNEMGIIDAFSDGAADFSGLTDDAQLVINSVIHKTMVRMDEEGLVAAAVTSIGFVITSIGPTRYPKPILFKADHPFQMFIIDGEHDNTVLFMGQIVNPGIPETTDEPSFVEPTNPWNNFTDYTTTTETPNVTYVCTQECRLCPDGSCEPKDDKCKYTIGCPDVNISSTVIYECTDECKLCPDGSCEPKDEKCQYSIGCPATTITDDFETSIICNDYCKACPDGSCQQRDENCEYIPCVNSGSKGLYTKLIMVIICVCLSMI